jgi:hypothetical protein
MGPLDPTPGEKLDVMMYTIQEVRNALVRHGQSRGSYPAQRLRGVLVSLKLASWKSHLC